jgi:ParB-like chromosome segregation protein Spo0J
MEHEEVAIEGKEVVMVNIADITVGERFRKRFVKIDELAESIEKIGLQNPVILKPDKSLISGGRRIEAFKLLCRVQSPARFFDTEHNTIAEIDENNMREPFSISEKLAIADVIEAEINVACGERRGRKAKDVDSKEVKKMEEYPATGEERREYVAKKAGFGNNYTMRQARHVLDNAIPEVIEAMDDALVSINYAHKISQAPKRKQLTLLNEACIDSETDVSGLESFNKERRKAKRNTKMKRPTDPAADPIYSIVKLSPDWYNEVFADIAETPIHNYINPQVGVLVIVCPNDFIGNALELVAQWNMHYKSLITIYTKKDPNVTHLDYINKRATHLVIAQMDETVDPGYTHIDPVFDRHDHFDAIEDILSEIWAPEETKIDMSSTEKRKGWSNWKIDYATPNEEEEVVVEPDGDDAHGE